METQSNVFGATAEHPSASIRNAAAGRAPELTS